MSDALIVSPGMYIRLKGRCPSCDRKLKAKHVRPNRTHTCGAFLPEGWEGSPKGFELLERQGLAM